MQNLKIIFFRSYLALEVLLVLFPVTFSSGFTFFSRRLALAGTTCDYNGIFLKFLTALEVIPKSAVVAEAYLQLVLLGSLK